MKKKIIVLLVLFVFVFGSMTFADVQEWDNYPDSVCDLELYPYQMVLHDTNSYLVCADQPFYWDSVESRFKFDGVGDAVGKYSTELSPNVVTWIDNYDWVDYEYAFSNHPSAVIDESNFDVLDYSDKQTVVFESTSLEFYQSDSMAFNLKAEDLVQNEGYRVYEVEHVVDSKLKATTKLAVPSTYDSVLDLYSVSGSYVEVAHTGVSSVFYYDTPDMREDQFGTMDVSADYDIYSFPDGRVPAIISEEEITNLYKMYVVDSGTIELVDSLNRDLGSSWNLLYNPAEYSGSERWGLHVDLVDANIVDKQYFIDNIHIGNDVAWTYVSDDLVLSDGHITGYIWFDYSIWLNVQYTLDIKYFDLLYDSVTINSISTTGETQTTTGNTGIESADFDLGDWLLHPIELMTSIFRNLAGQAMSLVELIVPAHIFPPEFTALLMLAVVCSLLLVILGRR